MALGEGIGGGHREASWVGDVQARVRRSKVGRSRCWGKGLGWWRRAGVLGW